MSAATMLQPAPAILAALDSVGAVPVGVERWSEGTVECSGNLWLVPDHGPLPTYVSIQGDGDHPEALIELFARLAACNQRRLVEHAEPRRDGEVFATRALVRVMQEGSEIRSIEQEWISVREHTERTFAHLATEWFDPVRTLDSDAVTSAEKTSAPTVTRRPAAGKRGGK